MITITLVPRQQTEERMDGWMDGRFWEIHLPLRPKGFPNQEAERHMRTKLPTSTDIAGADTAQKHAQNQASEGGGQQDTSLQHMKSTFMCGVVVQ